MNTNVINDGELLFSDEYILKNKKIVSKFISELALESDITNIEIESSSLALVVLEVLNNFKVINSLTIRKDDVVNFTIVEAIIRNKNIKKLNCYTAPEFAIQYFDKHNIELVTRSEIFFTSKFMDKNELNSYSNIYYKRIVEFDCPISKDDVLDFEAFLKINKYLQIIHISKYSDSDIELLIKIIKKKKIRDISILIDNNTISESEAIKIKSLNKKHKGVFKIKINYSKDYIRNNYLQYVSFSILKVSLVIVLLMTFTSFSYMFVSNYISLKNVDEITMEVDQIVNEVKERNDNNDIVESVHGPSVINELKKVNDDTVGWLTVRNTNIDYPVVQTSDNDFYLDRNYYQEKDYSGWVFMDFRNDIDEMDHNTIIYAHNRFDSGLMFGTLDNAKDEDWLANKNNHIITFNTLNEEMSFEIFSIYKIGNTNDYIANNFNSDNHYLTFIELISNRSLYDFDVNVTTDDYILTLSTCYEYTNRFVVHARLIK